MIIFLYGADSFRSRQKILEIKNKYLNSDKSGSGLSSFDLEERAASGEIINVCSTPNLLSPKRLLIVKNLLAASADEQKKVAEYLKKNKSIIDDKDLVAVFWEKNTPKKSNELFKFLEKSAKKQEFEKLDGARLSQWVLKRMKETDEKASISKAALSKLVSYSGGDTHVLDNEILKLVNYASGKMIEEKDVEILVREKIDGNIFSAIDALGANDKKNAMKLLHDNLEKGEDPFYIFSMFLYQFRNMLKISDLLEKGIRNEYEISRLTKTHPFVVRKSLATSRSFSFSRLKEIYKRLGEYDLKVKTGKIDMKLALDKFVAEL